MSGSTRTPVTPGPTSIAGLVGGDTSSPNPYVSSELASVAPIATSTTYIGGAAIPTNSATANTLVSPPQLNVPADTSAPTTPVAASMSAAQQTAAIQNILQSGGGIQNPLNSFFQVSPVFKLFMTQDIDPFTASVALGKPLGNNPGAGDIYKILDMLQSVVLAETGVTGYNIRSVEIESLVAPNSASGITNANSFTITITEAMGIGFPESILAAAKALGVRNHLKSFFYLEMHFIAYDTAGNVVSNPVQGLNLLNRWIWQLGITNIDVHLDAGGGTYTISALPYGEFGAYDESVKFVPGTVASRGSTLKEFTDNLSVALNNSWKDRYGNEVTKYAFKWHKLSETLQGSFGTGFDDPGSYSTSFTNIELSSLDGLSMVNGTTPTFIMQSGVPIDKILLTVIANTANAQALIKDDPVVGQTTDNQSGFQKSIIFMIEPDVQLYAFETFTRQYYKNVTYHIRPYYTQHPITSVDQPIQAAKPGVSYQAIQDTIKQGLLNKRYEYIYTGLNNDVIDFDIKYNFQWEAILSRFDGARTNYDAFASTSRIDPTKNPVGSGGIQYAQPDLVANQVKLQQALADANAAFQSASVNVTQKSDALSSLRSQIAADAAPTPEIIKAQADLTAAQSAKTQAAAQNIAVQNATKANLASQVLQNSGSTTFAEDLLGTALAPPSSNGQFTNLPVAFVQGFKGVEDHVGTGAIAAANRDKSVFAAAMGQMLSPIAQQFMSITLGIRGDPYWLGQTNLLRTIQMRSDTPAPSTSTSTPDTYVGNAHFLLHFRAPIRVGDDFAPDFRDSLSFNGLYTATSIRHSFGGGDGFKQEIVGLRLPLVDLVDAQTNQTPTTSTPANDWQQGLPRSGNATANPALSQTGAGTDWYNSPQAAPYKASIDAAAAQYGVPPSLLAWQIGQESSFRNLAASGSTSSGQPVGIAQITTGTAQNVPGYGAVDPTDPNASIFAAAAYDQHLYNNNGQNWQTALTKYGTLSGNPSQATWNGFYTALNTPTSSGT